MNPPICVTRSQRADFAMVKLPLLVQIPREPGVGEPIRRHVEGGQDKGKKKQSAVGFRKELGKFPECLPPGFRIAGRELSPMFHPDIGFRQPSPDHDNQQRRKDRYQEGSSPADYRCDKSSDDRGESDADRGAGLHVRTIATTDPGRKCFADVRLSGGPFPADACAGDAPEHDQQFDPRRESTQKGSNAVGQNGPLEHALSPEPIREHPEQNAAECCRRKRRAENE